MARASSVGKGGRSSFSPASASANLRADDVVARRQELPELDVGGAEPVQRVGDAPPALRRRKPARLHQPRQPERRLRARRQLVDVDEAEEAGAGKREAGADEPHKIAHALKAP